MLEELNITAIRKSMGYELSGGERRRTEIARALALNPKFILLDEPFAGVDPIAVEDIQEIVEGLAKRDIGVLITDHNVHETLSITNHAHNPTFQDRAIHLSTHFQARRNRTTAFTEIGEATRTKQAADFAVRFPESHDRGCW